MGFNTHDLLEIDSFKNLQNQTLAPSWVVESIIAAPYVVVRRAQQSDLFVAVGVRGKTRAERWADSVAIDCIKRVVTPMQLRVADSISENRIKEVPALRQLQVIEKLWHQLELQWGPGGSVGFELATGYPSSTATSDLDIVLFAPNPFNRQFARNILASLEEFKSSVDVLVETSEYAFLLKDFAHAEKEEILLRSADGVLLGTNPWHVKAISELKRLSTPATLL